MRDYDLRLAACQRELARLEGDRVDGDSAPVEMGPRSDAIDTMPALSVAADPSPLAEDEPMDLHEYSDDVSLERRKRMFVYSLMQSALEMLSQPTVKRPRLKAAAWRLAMGFPGAPSMRQCAEKFGVSGERVSQLVEELQEKFRLPKNQNNKSQSAVNSYRSLAREGNVA